MPLARRVPKRGFVNGAFKKDFAIVNLEKIDAAFEAGAVIDEAALRAKGLVKGGTTTASRSSATASVTKALTIHAQKFSESAAAKIAAAGGSVVVV